MQGFVLVQLVCACSQSFIAFVFHRHELGFSSPESTVPLFLFVSLLRPLFADLFVRWCVSSFVCLFALALFLLTLYFCRFHLAFGVISSFFLKSFRDVRVLDRVSFGSI